MVFLRGAAQSERRVRHEASQRRFASLGQRDNCVFLALWCGPGVIVASALVLAEAKPRLLCLSSHQATRKRRAKKRCRPANTKQHWACACSRRRLFCFCSSRRSLFTLRLVSRSFAPLVPCPCSQRWSLLLGIVFALFPVCCASCRVVEPGPYERPKSSGADRRSLCFFCVRSVPTQCFA